MSTSASRPAPASAAASASVSTSISRCRCRPSPAPGAAAEPPPRPCRAGGGIRTVRWPQRAPAAVPSVFTGLRGGPRRGGQRLGACARQADLPRVSEARGGSRGQGSRPCPPRPCPGAGGLEAALTCGATGTGIVCKCSHVSVMKAAGKRRLKGEDAISCFAESHPQGSGCFPIDCVIAGFGITDS